MKGESVHHATVRDRIEEEKQTVVLGVAEALKSMVSLRQFTVQTRENSDQPLSSEMASDNHLGDLGG